MTAEASWPCTLTDPTGTKRCGKSGEHVECEFSVSTTLCATCGTWARDPASDRTPIDARHHRNCPERDTEPREPGCKCQWEAGDSPCPVHGEDEETNSPAPADTVEAWISDAMEVGGYSREDACPLLRASMERKSFPTGLARQKGIFVHGARSRGIDEEHAANVFDRLASIASRRAAEEETQCDNTAKPTTIDSSAPATTAQSSTSGPSSSTSTSAPAVVESKSTSTPDAGESSSTASDDAAVEAAARVAWEAYRAAGGIAEWDSQEFNDATPGYRKQITAIARAVLAHVDSAAVKRASEAERKIRDDIREAIAGWQDAEDDLDEVIVLADAAMTEGLRECERLRAEIDASRDELHETRESHALTASNETYLKVEVARLKRRVNRLLRKLRDANGVAATADAMRRERDAVTSRIVAMVREEAGRYRVAMRKYDGAEYGYRQHLHMSEGMEHAADSIEAEQADPLKVEAAFVVDGSGYQAGLQTLPTFSCALWEPQQ